MSNDRFLHDRIYRGEQFEKFPIPHIVICGMGTLGSNLLDNLIRQNITNLAVVDDDRIEPHNLGNQIWKSENIGQKKVDSAASHAYTVVEAEIKTFGKRLDAKNVKKVLGDADLVIDGFDNTLSRTLVKDYCTKANIPCLHIGLAADYCEVVWNDKYKVPADSNEDVCDYPLTRHISMVAVVLASEQIIAWISGSELKNSCFTLKDFKRNDY